MTSIEFGKKSRTLNKQYKELFGSIPCLDDYICTQEEFLDALGSSIENKKEIKNYLEERPCRDYSNPNIRY